MTLAAPPATPSEGVPVIAIDGPAASGKGTVAARVARALGFHLLDSGALYRLVALKAIGEGAALDDAGRAGGLARALDIRFEPERVFLDGVDVTRAIRDEAVSEGASQVAVHREVRSALLDRQRAFRRPPGLVADGRDMGTIVFPDARTKVFVTATPEARAKRRRLQLAGRGVTADEASLLADIVERDRRDASRTVAPLEPAVDAAVLDTTDLSIDETVARVLERYAARGR